MTPAGLDLDREVAAALGWTGLHIVHDEPKEWHQPNLRGTDPEGLPDWVPSYSTSMHGAMILFQLAVERFGCGQIIADTEDDQRQGFRVWVTFGVDNEGDAIGALPEAVCEAVLEAFRAWEQPA